VSTFFYHCTVNTADILLAASLKRWSSDYLGIKSISFFYEPNRAITETDRYYDAPDNKRPHLLGESGDFTIKSAFCFEQGALRDQFPAVHKEKAGFEDSPGLIRKGAHEYLFPADLGLDNAAFWGIRVPGGYIGESKIFFVRAVAMLYLLDRPNIRVAHGCNDFYRAETKFYKVSPKLSDLKLNFRPTADNWKLVKKRIDNILL
jgi:hypothetical protein